MANTNATEKVGQKSQKSDQMVVITVDDELEKIVELDSKGKRLRFDPDPDRFKQIEAKDLGKLSDFNKLAYQIAREEYQENLDELKSEEDDLLKRISTGVEMGRATQRLHIDGKQQGFVYTWIRPDQMADYTSANRGWQVVKNGPERTLSNQTGRGPHVIGTKGSEELIAVKRSAAADRAETRARKQKRQQQLHGELVRARQAVEEAGVESIGDEDGRAWRDRVGESE